jgi:hypothetical protein
LLIKLVTPGKYGSKKTPSNRGGLSIRIKV